MKFELNYSLLHELILFAIYFVCKFGMEFKKKNNRALGKYWQGSSALTMRIFKEPIDSDFETHYGGPFKEMNTNS